MNGTIHKPSPSSKSGDRVVKLLGGDVELGNFIEGSPRNLIGRGARAARLLLREVDGLPGPTHYTTGWGAPSGYAGSWSGYYNPQDWGRKYLASNGGCIYIDLNHLELCLPEVLSARDYTAAWYAMLEIARLAQETANTRLPPGQRIVVLANNSDGQGASYGAHLNVLLTRRLWDNLFRNKIYPSLFFLMAYQVSSIVFTGQGKVGAENGRTPVAYQITQRADFIETLMGDQTTYNRPLVNSRDEALCGQRYGRDDQASSPSETLARLHVIFYDANLSSVASFLKAGVLQIILAMCEAGWIKRDLLLDDPLDALFHWGRDPDLKAQARLTDGKAVTATELQLLFLEQAKIFVDAGKCEGYVPDASAIIALWENTLVKLKERDFQALAPRLDWVLKRTLIERFLHQHPGLSWESPQVKHLDLIYASLDPNEGLYWVLQRNGLMEQAVSKESVHRFLQEPPSDTRAWTRAMLLRRAGPGAVVAVNWDQVRLRSGRGQWPLQRTIRLADPLGFTQAQFERHFQSTEDLDALIDVLEVRPAGVTAQSEPDRSSAATLPTIRTA